MKTRVILLLLALLAAMPGAQPLQAQSAGPRAQRWASGSVLARGRWFRITVQSDGIYCLTRSQLSEMGFDPANVRVYGYGGHRLDEQLQPDTDWDDLEEVSLLPVADGYLFAANGLVHWSHDRHVQNHYARAASYFVTSADTPVPAFPAEGQPFEPSEASAATTTFTAHAVHDPQVYAYYQGGRKLFDGTQLNGSSATYELPLPAYVASPGGRLRVSFAASNLQPLELTTTFNGLALPPQTFPAYPDDYSYAVVRCDSFDVSNVGEPCSLQLATSAGRRGRLDYAELVYTGLARISPERPVVQFSLRHRTAILAEYAPGQQPQLWRLAEPGRPAARLSSSATTSADGRQLLCTRIDDDGAAHRYVLFDAAAPFGQPALAGAVDNQDLHATAPLDMIIITPASGIFDAEARRLADVHREADGLRVGVFRADQIYNEFSSGTPDATAYRRFLKMLYDRAAGKLADAPRYLLLFGDGAWDNRMLSSSWQNYSPDDFLLCYESENSVHNIKCYVDEDYFALLDDGEGVSLTSEYADMGVGRFPVRTADEARALVDKTIAYIRRQHAGPWRNVVCVMGDDGDENQHQRMADEVAARLSRQQPALEVRKIYWDAYQRETSGAGNRYPQVQQILRKQMQEGALMMNYTGHGETYTISQEQVLRVEDFAESQTQCLPLWVTAACDIMPFDGQKSNIGEAAVLNPDGGAVAFYGTARTVYANSNGLTNNSFCTALFASDELGRPNRLGDAVRISKMIRDASHPENRIHFILLGDPALLMSSGGCQVVVDSINGIPVDQVGIGYTVSAGDKLRVAGHVEGPARTVSEDFDGLVSVRLYDSPSTVTCLKNDPTVREAYTFQSFDRHLYDVQGRVRRGRFAVTCPVPVDISYSNEPGRLLFYALSDDSTAEATGCTEAFCLGGTADGLDDFEGPDIVAYLDREDFADGDAVGPQPTLVAFLSDESGINYLDSGIGHNLELILDNNTSASSDLNAFYRPQVGDYTRGTVSYELPLLEEGTHRLRFRAWDLLNNYSSVTLRFTVDSSLENAISLLPADGSPRSGSRASSAVYDLSGRRVEGPSSRLRPGLYIVGGKRVLVR